MKHDYNVKWHAYNVKKHEYNVTRHGYCSFYMYQKQIN